MRSFASALALGAFSLFTAPAFATPGVRSSDEEPPDSDDASDAPAKNDVSFGLAGGPEFRRLYDIPISGFDVRAMLGPETTRPSNFLPAAFVSMLLANTEAGLGVHHVVAGARFEAASRYFYGGVSLAMGYLWIDRARGGGMGNFDGVVDLFVGPQVPLGDHLTLSLEGRVSAELLPGTDNAIAYGPGVAVRARFY